MTLQTVPHLNFRGQARAALEHYQSAFGGDLVVITYEQMGTVEDPAEGHHVIWGQVAAATGFTVMAHDVPASRPWSAGDDPFFASVRGTDPDELTAAWERLAEGGTVRQALGPSQWAPLYGMVRDRFGVTWVLDIAAPHGG